MTALSSPSTEAGRWEWWWGPILPPLSCPPASSWRIGKKPTRAGGPRESLDWVYKICETPQNISNIYAYEIFFIKRILKGGTWIQKKGRSTAQRPPKPGLSSASHPGGQGWSGRRPQAGLQSSWQQASLTAASSPGSCPGLILALPGSWSLGGLARELCHALGQRPPSCAPGLPAQPAEASHSGAHQRGWRGSQQPLQLWRTSQILLAT